MHLESSLAISLDGVPGGPRESVVRFSGASSDGGISDGAGPLFAGLVKLLGGLRFTPPLEVGGRGFLPRSSLHDDSPDI